LKKRKKIEAGNTAKMKKVHLMFFETDLISKIYTGYFTSINEPGGIENATHNTFPVVNIHEKNREKKNK
jgi:hypothetical protein